MSASPRQLLTLALLGLSVAGCNGLEPFGVEVREFDLGVESQLTAVIYEDYSGDEARVHALGSGGTIVNDAGQSWQAEAALHDLAFVGPGADTGPRLVAVGAGGFVAVSAPLTPQAELEFVPVPVPSSATLRAVAADTVDGRLRVVAAGDEILLVGQEDEQGELIWTEAPAPLGGWGQLRDLGDVSKFTAASLDLNGLCAVGDQGRMLCVDGEGPELANWAIIPLDTDADLNAFCGSQSDVVVGDRGTFVAIDRDGEGHVGELDPGVDLLACTTLYVDPTVAIGSDRRLYALPSGEVLTELDWQPRAFDPLRGYVLVGDEGRAGFLEATGFYLQ